MAWYTVDIVITAAMGIIILVAIVVSVNVAHGTACRALSIEDYDHFSQACMGCLLHFRSGFQSL